MSAIQVSLLNTASAKAQAVVLPSTMTVAELQKLAPGSKAVTFTVAGCTPAGATTLGDLHAACAKEGVLEVAFNTQSRMGVSVCTPCCSFAMEPSGGGGGSAIPDPQVPTTIPNINGGGTTGGGAGAGTGGLPF